MANRNGKDYGYKVKWALLPKVPLILLTVTFLILTACACIVATSHPIVFFREYQIPILLNENQILYLFSTTAQVIAAIYGLTLTGFIFFRNELSRDEQDDETLAPTIDALLRRYFVMLAFITALVGATLLLSNAAIVVAGRQAEFDRIIAPLAINAGQSGFIVSLASILYFIFDVVAPDRIQRASRSLQQQIDPNWKEPGSLKEFIKYYNKIEGLLREVGERYGERLQNENIGTRKWSNVGRARPISNIRLVEILFRNKLIGEELFSRLRKLITLRNTTIHSSDPVVSPSSVRDAQQILGDLKSALDLGSVTK